jgi:hypothetical protein
MVRMGITVTGHIGTKPDPMSDDLISRVYRELSRAAR